MPSKAKHGDPTAAELIEAMELLKLYTLDSQISLEGESLVAIVQSNMEILEDDQVALEKLGWELVVRDGRPSHFHKAFQDH